MDRSPSPLCDGGKYDDWAMEEGSRGYVTWHGSIGGPSRNLSVLVPGRA